MALRLFESNPISYRMDRKSPEAIKLRDAVNKKLFDFLGNYTDDVLAEYIVVLVCNGKHQNQAREDLEAFLGNDSGIFVAWLWSHLARENYIPRAPLDSSSLKAQVSSSHEGVFIKEQSSSSPLDCHTHSAETSDPALPIDGRYNTSYQPTNSNCLKAIEIPESLQRWCPTINASLTEENTERFQSNLIEVDIGRKQTEPMEVNNDTRSAYLGGATKHISIARCSPESPSVVEQLQNGCQQQKIAKINSSAMPHRPLYVPRTEHVARGLRSVIIEDHQSTPLNMKNSPKMRLHSTTIDSATQHIVRPRGNVWDRLGKPRNEDDAEMRGITHLHDNHLIESYLPDFQGGELQNPRSLRVRQHDGLSSNLLRASGGFDNSYHKVVISSTECRKPVHSSNIVADHSLVNSFKRKGLYNESNSANTSASYSGCKENQLQLEEAPPKMLDCIPFKHARLKKIGSEAKGSITSVSESKCNSVISAWFEQKPQAYRVNSVFSSSVERNAQEDNVSSTQLAKNMSLATQTKKVVLHNSQLPSNSESPRNADSASANYHRPVKDEVLDVKCKLRQMETDMLKLRSKQGDMRKDAKPKAVTDMQNHSEEAIESRTVLVTNVHFAASREALSSHFSKCGTIAKVIMLTDTITAQPKGAAYIVFSSKYAVEKAVSMSRTSFFSRILTVMRKAEMPPDFLVPISQSPAAKLMLQQQQQQPFYPQPFWNGFSGHRKNFTSAHLQWKRENPAAANTKDNSISGTTNGIKSTTTSQ